MNKKKLFIILLTLLSLSSSSFAQSKKLSKRLDYFKSQPIYVTLFTLNMDSIELFNLETKNEIIANNNKENSNIRFAFNTFWDLNDTIIF